MTFSAASAQTCSPVLLEASIKSISLEWKACIGVEFSRLRMQGPTGTFRVVHDGPGVTYAATGLTPDTDYRFRLQVRTAAGWQRLGEEVTFRTKGTPPCPVKPAGCPLDVCAFAPMAVAPGPSPDCAARQQLANAASTDLTRIEASIKAALGELRKRRGAGTTPPELEEELQAVRSIFVAASGPSEAALGAQPTGDAVATFYRDAFGFQSVTAFFATAPATDFATQAGVNRLRTMSVDEIYDALEGQITALAAQSSLKKARQGDSARCPNDAAAAQTELSRAQAEESGRVPGYTSCDQSWPGKWQACSGFARAAWEHVLQYKLDAEADCGYPISGAPKWR